LGLIQKGIDIYLKILEKKPDNPKFNYNVGVMYLGMRKYPDSIKYFEIAKKLNHTKAEEALLQCYYESGDSGKFNALLETLTKNNSTINKDTLVSKWNSSEKSKEKTKASEIKKIRTRFISETLE